MPDDLSRNELHRLRDERLGAPESSLYPPHRLFHCWFVVAEATLTRLLAAVLDVQKSENFNEAEPEEQGMADAGRANILPVDEEQIAPKAEALARAYLNAADGTPSIALRLAAAR
jgi:hypothetical protein